MLHVGIGQAEGTDTRECVERAIKEGTAQLRTTEPDAGIVFAGPHFDHLLMLEIINDSFTDIQLVGCSTAGNFSSQHGASDDAITLIFMASETICFAAGAGNKLATDWQAAVDQAIVSATGSLDEAPSLCLTFPNGYAVDFEPVLERLDTKLGPCEVFGGLSGILFSEPSEMLQFCGREVMRDGLPILLLGGPVSYRFGIANSWRPVGKRALVTRSDDRIVHEIGGFKGVDYYRHYLGYHEEPAREFNLAVYSRSGSEYYMSSPIQYNEDGSITFTGPVPEGSEVQLTEAIREDLIADTLQTSASLNHPESAWKPALALNFSCGYRKTILGTSVDKELEAFKQESEAGLPIGGFFSFGEIAPLGSGQPSVVQGATLIALLIGPRSAELSPSVDLKLEKPDPSFGTEIRDPEFLKRRLIRSEAYRQRLESLNDFTTKLHHQMMGELENARLEIERKEMKLRESEEKFRRIVQTAGEGFILMDESFIIIDTNQAFSLLSGYNHDELMERSIVTLAHPDDRSLLESTFEQLLEAKYQRFETRLVNSEGRTVPVLVHSNIVRNDQGGLIGGMAFFADLTEQKKALMLAGEVQKSLLPQENPNISGLDIAGRSISCDEVGGDYYDFFFQQDQPGQAFSVAVGDITGHGVDAALLMSSARAFLRMHAGRDDAIVDIVKSMNNHLAADVLETHRFMTLFYLSISADLSSLEWVRAGHDPAILYDPLHDRVEELKGPGIALGVSPDFDYQAMHKSELQNGSILAIGTDGIWETFNQDGEMFGRERFMALLRRHAELPAADLLNLVFTEVEQFRQGRRSEDDITLVIIKIKQP